MTLENGIRKELGRTAAALCLALDSQYFPPQLHTLQSQQLLPEKQIPLQCPELNPSTIPRAQDEAMLLSFARTASHSGDPTSLSPRAIALGVCLSVQECQPLLGPAGELQCHLLYGVLVP